MLEERLPLGDDVSETGRTLAAIVCPCLSALGHDGDPRTIQDVLAMIRALVDSAARNHERDLTSLTIRVRRAVFGYLVPSAGRPAASLK